MLGRPIGRPIFGNHSDPDRPQAVGLITGSEFTLMTTLMGCLPGYGTGGYGSIGALIALRLIGGIFLGGGFGFAQASGSTLGYPETGLAAPHPGARPRLRSGWRHDAGALYSTATPLGLMISIAASTCEMFS